MSSLATGWVCFVQLIQGMFVRGWCSQVTAGASAVFVPMGGEAGRGRLRGGLLRAGRQGVVMARDGWLPRFEREAASKFTTTKIFSLQK